MTDRKETISLSAEDILLTVYEISKTISSLAEGQKRIGQMVDGTKKNQKLQVHQNKIGNSLSLNFTLG